MSKRINSYQAVAAFVRGFFEAYARGIIDATIEGNDFSKKNDPKQIKQMMLEHYGEVNQYFFDIMFSTLVRLNYKTAEEANERMKKNFDSMKQADPTFEPTMLDYLRIACKSNQLYKAMESEYKRNFTWLLQGKFTTLEEHVRDYTHGILISLADEPMAIHLLVRIIVKATATPTSGWPRQSAAVCPTSAAWWTRSPSWSRRMPSRCLSATACTPKRSCAHARTSPTSSTPRR